MPGAARCREGDADSRGTADRPWFRHSIYAPGQYTGYAAVVIPGVNEAIDRGDLQRTEQQIAAVGGGFEAAAFCAGAVRGERRRKDTN